MYWSYRNTEVMFRYCWPAMHVNKIALHYSTISLAVDLELAACLLRDFWTTIRYSSGGTLAHTDLDYNLILTIVGEVIPMARSCKSRKDHISFVMSVRLSLSVRKYGDGYHWTLFFF